MKIKETKKEEELWQYFESLFPHLGPARKVSDAEWKKLTKKSS